MKTILTRVLAGRAWAWTALLVQGLVQAAPTGVLSADKSVVAINTPTQVTFRLAVDGGGILPPTVNLQRQNGATWSAVGRMYDDGTHGDTLSGDGIYAAQTWIHQSVAGQVLHRASFGITGVLARTFSNQTSITVANPLSLMVESGSTEIVMTVGETANLVTTVLLVHQGPGAMTVDDALSIAPGNGGLALVSSDYPPGGYSSATSQSFVLNQRFKAVTVGDYVIENHASIVGQGIAAVGTAVVHVVAAGGAPVILPLGSEPSAIPVNTSTPVLFTAGIAHHTTPPAALDLHFVDGTAQVVVGVLKDDGTGGDLVAGDGIFSGQFAVLAPAEGSAQFVASGVFPGVGERQSNPFGLVVTPLPTAPMPALQALSVLDPSTGQAAACNEVLVTVDPHLTSAQIEALAGSVGATVVGSVAGLAVYQFGFANPGCTWAGVSDMIAAITGKPGVVHVGPDLLAALAAVTPNDPRYATQYAPRLIRAEEAWVIARGGPMIAVVDTGVDYNHPDLAGKVIKGRDFVNGDMDPMDDQGHGTHVAGIAAAHGDNGIGVAGIAWNSPILAIKVVDNHGWGSSAQVAAGIKSAADSGARVINTSLGFLAHNPAVEAAVNYATGKGSLVVAAAGNNANSIPMYPGAYPNALCVGSTTSGDTRSSFSCFGPHVDIAAPGSSILSTGRGGGYCILSGTSMATPCVAGVAAVLWSRFPSYTLSQIRTRLANTAMPMPGAQLGAGRVDLFESVFNGSFEDGAHGWTITGTAGSIRSLGPLTPTHRAYFGFASSGPDAAVVKTTFQQSFTLQPGVATFAVRFSYNFVTEEYPEWVHRGYNDTMTISLIKPDGGLVQLALEDVDNSSFSLVGGIDFPGGDHTVGQTGWKTVSASIPITSGPGLYRVVVEDRGDGIYDSNVLIDHIEFR